jgi:hypothetical protein
MYELPLALRLATDAVRSQFDPATPPEPARPHRSFRPVRQARAATAALLHRAARAVAPAQPRGPARIHTSSVDFAQGRQGRPCVKCVLGV